MSVPSPSLPSPPALSPSPLPLQPPGATSAELLGLYQSIVGLYAAGKYEEAVPLAEEYVAQVEHSPDDPERRLFANAISLLSRLYQVQGRYRDTEPLLQRSLDILDGKSGTEGEVATELDALAQLYESQGEFEKAEPLFVRALAISEKNAAADPRRYGRALNDLAWVYQDEGRYAEAEPLASQALDVLAKAFGKKDSDFGCTLDTLAKLYEG
jgi:tetratricopeptide (TPR) repeat protein